MENVFAALGTKIVCDRVGEAKSNLGRENPFVRSIDQWLMRLAHRWAMEDK